DHRVRSAGVQRRWARAKRLMEQVGDRPVVAASAIIGRLRPHRDRRGGQAPGGVEAGCGPCSARDKNVFNALAAELADQQWEGSATEAAGDADHRPTVDDAEAVPERPEHVERVAGLQLREQAGSRTDRLEDEAAGIVLDPCNAERSSQQRRGGLTTSQLRKRARRCGCGEVRQSRDQLQESAAKPFHHEHLTGLEGGPAQIGGHDTAWTTPSRYSRTVATLTLFPDVWRPMASTSAAAVSSDVQLGMRRCSAASRMRYPSFTVRPTAASAPPSARKSSSSVPKFETVLITMDTRPSSITSMTLGRPWPILPTDTAEMPALASAAADPAVA